MKIPAKVACPELALNPAVSVPLHRQVYDGLRATILSGRIAPGVRLPPSRELAMRLGVSRNTVLAAYDELAADELVTGHVGSGTRIHRGSRVARLIDPDGHTIDCVGR